MAFVSQGDLLKTKYGQMSVWWSILETSLPGRPRKISHVRDFTYVDAFLSLTGRKSPFQFCAEKMINFPKSNDL